MPKGKENGHKTPVYEPFLIKFSLWRLRKHHRLKKLTKEVNSHLIVKLVGTETFDTTP